MNLFKTKKEIYKDEVIHGVCARDCVHRTPHQMYVRLVELFLFARGLAEILGLVGGEGYGSLDVLFCSLAPMLFQDVN